jgi:hypothetical protein
MADMGEIEDNERVLLYRPYIFLSRRNGEWSVTFDWEDSYQGYEDGFDFNPFTPADLGLRAYISEGDEFLSEFLKKNAVWDVSVH